MTPQREDSGPVTITRVRVPIVIVAALVIGAVSGTAGTLAVAHDSERAIDERIDRAVAKSRAEMDAINAERFGALRAQLDRIERQLESMKK